MICSLVVFNMEKQNLKRRDRELFLLFLKSQNVIKFSLMLSGSNYTTTVAAALLELKVAPSLNYATAHCCGSKMEQ